MGSPFWQYFHDKLIWLPIFRPGPLSALARGLALHFDSCRQDIIWLRNQWIVTKAEQEMVAKYGESRGMPRFRFDTDETYRNRVHNAFVWHKLGGKVRGLERIYAENGLEATVSSSPDPELWAHFRVRIDVTDLFFGMDALEMVFWLANEFKPARSVLEGLWTSSITKQRREIAIGLLSRAQSKCCLWFEPPEVSQMRLVRATGLSTWTDSSMRLYFTSPEIPKTEKARLAGARSLSATRLYVHFNAPEIPQSRKKLALGMASWTSTRVALGHAA